MATERALRQELKKQADWLASEYPSAAASLLEDLEETFTWDLWILPAAFDEDRQSEEVMVA